MLRCSNLRCEGMVNPLGIDITHPRLTWIIESEERNTLQSACQIIVSKSLEEIKSGVGSFFDSGRLDGDSIAFILEKPASESATRYTWAVRVWDNHGEASDWSEPQWFETGLLHQEDWVAKWIEPDQKPVVKEGLNLAELAGSLSGFDDPTAGSMEDASDPQSEKGKQETESPQTGEDDVPPELIAKLRELLADGLDLSSPATLMKLPKLLSESLPKGTKLSRKMLKRLPELLAEGLPGDDESSSGQPGGLPDPMALVASIRWG